MRVDTPETEGSAEGLFDDLPEYSPEALATQHYSDPRFGVMHTLVGFTPRSSALTDCDNPVSHLQLIFFPGGGPSFHNPGARKHSLWQAERPIAATLENHALAKYVLLSIDPRASTPDGRGLRQNFLVVLHILGQERGFMLPAFPRHLRRALRRELAGERGSATWPQALVTLVSPPEFHYRATLTIRARNACVTFESGRLTYGDGGAAFFLHRSLLWFCKRHAVNDHDQIVELGLVVTNDEPTVRVST